jgi:beta-lactamase regulating signal transducer with metallopeptidase domain
MNQLLRWLTSPEWTHLVGALLHSLWQGAIIAIALAVLLRRLTIPVTRYRCAVGMLGMLVVASIITWAVLNEPKPTTPIASFFPVAESEFASTPTAALNLNPTDRVVVVGIMSPPAAPTNWTAWLALVWILGATAMLLRAGIKVAGAENLRRSCQPLDDERMLTLVAEACRAVDLARKIRVAVTDKLTSPAVVGVIVPTLILPLSLFSTLTPEQIRFVLLHELAHIRRGDYLANLFQLFAEALLFFNPAVWWISHQIRREREACCDALAIELSGAPADYARTLVRVAENMVQPTTTAALAFGNDGREPSPLADRVQRLLVPGYRPSLRLTWRAILTSLIVGGTLLVLLAVGTRNTVGAILISNQPPAIANTLLPVPSPTNVTEQNEPTTNTNNDVAIEITGGSVSSSVEAIEDIVTVTNGAIVKFNDQKLTADFVRVNQRTGQLMARGNVRFETTKGTTSADEFRGSIKNNRGNMAENSWMIQWDTTNSESINEQWFWYRGDDTITWPATATTNTASAEPLTERTFEVDLGLFYAAAQKSSGLSEPVTQTNVGHSIRPFFANAGVNLDPALGKGFVLSTSRGDMWVRATAHELDAIEALLRPMPGTTLTRRSYHFDSNTLAKVTAVLSPEISSIVATNPAAGFRALLESFNRNDPRPKQVRYLAEREEIYARATESDFERFESALKGTLTIKPAPELQRPPESSRNRNQSQESENSTTLATRTFQVEPTAIAKALEPVTGKQGSTAITAENLRYFMHILGVDLSPPKSIYYNNHAGGLFVRATMDDLDTIGTVLKVIGLQQAQVNLKVRWVEIPQSFMASALLPSPTNSLSLPAFRAENHSGILTEQQMADVIRRIESRDGIVLLNESQITTTSERQAQLQVSEVKTIVSGINPKALTKPGVASTNLIATQNTPLGPVIDLYPTVSSDGAKVSLSTTVSITEFLGYEKPAKKITVYVNGKKTTTTFPQPKYRIRQMTNNCMIPDGQTLVLGNPTTTEVTTTTDGKVLNTTVSDTKTNLLFVFITATIVDSAGNPAKSDVGLPSKLTPSR